MAEERDRQHGSGEERMEEERAQYAVDTFEQGKKDIGESFEQQRQGGGGGGGGGGEGGKRGGDGTTSKKEKNTSEVVIDESGMHSLK